MFAGSTASNRQYTTGIGCTSIELACFPRVNAMPRERSKMAQKRCICIGQKPAQTKIWLYLRKGGAVKYDRDCGTVCLCLPFHFTSGVQAQPVPSAIAQPLCWP